MPRYWKNWLSLIGVQILLFLLLLLLLLIIIIIIIAVIIIIIIIIIIIVSKVYFFDVSFYLISFLCSVFTKSNYFASAAVVVKCLCGGRKWCLILISSYIADLINIINIPGAFGI